MTPKKSDYITHLATEAKTEVDLRVSWYRARQLYDVPITPEEAGTTSVRDIKEDLCRIFEAEIVDLGLSLSQFKDNE